MGTQLHLSDAQLGNYLTDIGIFPSGSKVAVEPAGDGNINWVRRATLKGAETRSVIVKQARPALEKFPEYAAPPERLAIEARWFEYASQYDETDICPEIHHFDPDHHVLVMEDLGHCVRLDEALAEGRDVTKPMIQLAEFLGRIHAASAREDAELAKAFSNEAMQRLHGEHIFTLPYQEEFPCPPETAARAVEIRKDSELADIAARAYERYLTPKGALVHADVQAGNILLGPSGPKLLDAEIAHIGDPAFDVGTLLAHLMLSNIAAGVGESAVARPVWSAYCGAHHGTVPRADDVVRYAGLELLRRTIGAARVPAVEDDDAGLRVLAAAVDMMRGQGENVLHR